MLQRELEEASTGNTTSTSNSGRLHSFWNNIWSSLIPSKIKCFIWRACIASLPLCTKLFDRHISSSFSYVLCYDATKSCSHLLWECFFAQAVSFQAHFGTLSNFLYILSLWISWILPFISYFFIPVCPNKVRGKLRA